MTNRLRYLTIVGVLASIAIAFVAGYLIGGKKYFDEMRNTVWGEWRSEFLLLKDNLERTNPDAQMREYLKDRLYAVAARLPKEALRREFLDFDFGPVDRSQLKGVRATALGGLEGRTYEAAKARHNPTSPRAGRLPAQSNSTAESDARKNGARGSP